MPVNASHTLVLDGSGYHFFTCGNNEHAQLGTGDIAEREIFTQVNLPEKFVCLSAGINHSLGISESGGSLWSWGLNQYGQLGQGTEVQVLSTPTQIPETYSLSQFCGRRVFAGT